MKQLSALGARRHAFYRGPRRMRPLGGRLEDADILGPGAYGYYGGESLGSPDQRCAAAALCSAALWTVSPLHDVSSLHTV